MSVNIRVSDDVWTIFKQNILVGKFKLVNSMSAGYPSGFVCNIFYLLLLNL